MKKLLNEKLNLGCVKLKVPRKGSHWAYVSFRNDDDKLKAIEVLNGYKWKGRTLKASVCNIRASIVDNLITFSKKHLYLNNCNSLYYFNEKISFLETG